MTSQHDKPKRWRARFSVRTLVILVTLACAYLACWGPTKKWGVEDVAHHVFVREVHSTEQSAETNGWLRERTKDGTWATSPFVIQYVPLLGSNRRYYLWFFGWVAKLPFERKMKFEEREQLWGELYPEMWPPSTAQQFGS